jgi:hypothetical protein
MSLYRDPPRMDNVLIIAGQQAYRSSDRTLRLTEIMRQGGDDEESMLFREFLRQLRNNTLTKEGWQLLDTRVRHNQPPELTMPFDKALQLYFTKDEVKNYNHDRMRDCNQPVKKLEARHTGSQVEKASSDEAEGLDLELDTCIRARIYLTQNLWVDHGLVNGSMGTVQELVWKEGQDPTKELPFAIMVEFDKYTRPAFPGHSFVPIFQSGSSTAAHYVRDLCFHYD